MKKMIMFGCAVMLTYFVSAQQKQGKIIYERTVQMQVRFQGMNEEMERMIPRSRTDMFELSFGNNQSLWKQLPQQNEDEAFGDAGGGGMQIRMVVAGSNDVLYTNFETGKRVEQRELFDKNFIVDDSIRPLKWKMTGETKMILNHNCIKATAEQINKRMQMNINDGKMERKEVTDTSVIVAWVATDIPVSAGPAEYQGQLPGTILEMDVANGRQVFKAVEIKEKADFASIKEPSGKKRYTQAEFLKERDKMMEEMQRNNMGGGRQIRIN